MLYFNEQSIFGLKNWIVRGLISQIRTNEPNRLREMHSTFELYLIYRFFINRNGRCGRCFGGTLSEMQQFFFLRFRMRFTFCHKITGTNSLGARCGERMVNQLCVQHLYRDGRVDWSMYILFFLPVERQNSHASGLRQAVQLTFVEHKTYENHVASPHEHFHLGKNQQKEYCTSLHTTPNHQSNSLSTHSTTHTVDVSFYQIQLLWFSICVFVSFDSMKLSKIGNQMHSFVRSVNGLQTILSF